MEALGRGLVLEPYLATGVIAPRLLARFGTRGAEGRASWPGSPTAGCASRSPRWSRRRATTCTTSAHAPSAAATAGRLRRRQVGRAARRQRRLADRHRAHMAGSADEALTLFLVDASAAGVRSQGFPTIDSQRAAEVRFDGVEVDDACVIGERRPGPGAGRMGGGPGPGGARGRGGRRMERLTELTCEYLRTRKQFGVADRQLPGAAAPRRRHAHRRRAGARAGVDGGGARRRRRSRPAPPRRQRRQGDGRPLRAATSASRPRSCTAAWA